MVSHDQLSAAFFLPLVYLRGAMVSLSYELSIWDEKVEGVQLTPKVSFGKLHGIRIFTKNQCDQLEFNQLIP